MPFAHHLLHLQCGQHHRQRCASTGIRHTTGRHVSVTDGLDLLHAVLLHEAVEGVEADIQLIHQVRRTELFADMREILEIAEEHGHLIEVARFSVSSMFQLGSHVHREDVVQQFFTAVLFAAQFVCALLHHALQLELLPAEGPDVEP